MFCSRERTGCPAYLRFKVSEDGFYLMLVAMNLQHNHPELEDNECCLVVKRKHETDEDLDESETKRFLIENELTEEDLSLLRNSIDEVYSYLN